MQSLIGKTTGDSLTAAEWNQLPAEVQNVITGLGITLISGDLDQLGKAIAGYVANGTFYTDSGAASAYVLTQIGSKQAPTGYTDGMEVDFLPGTTSGGASTVNVAGLGLKNIVDTDAAGRIVAGRRLKLKYRSGAGNFEILSETPAISSVSGTVAANALTVGLAAGSIDFRSSTLTDGDSVSRFIPAAISLVVPSGATLGTINTIQSRQVLLAIDNAGTVELAIVNLAGGNNLDETTLISTVAIDATADLDNVIYSTTARANVSFRVVGIIESTQAVAGTWATAPSLVQGAGGNALMAMSSLGYGQAWVSLSGSRVSGVTYYNTTGKPIMVSVATGGTSSGTIIAVDGVNVAENTNGAASSGNWGATAIVPAGSSYVVTLTGTVTIWSELR